MRHFAFAVGCFLTALLWRLTSPSLAAHDPAVTLRLASHHQLEDALTYLMQFGGGSVKPDFELSAESALYGIAKLDPSRPLIYLMIFPDETPATDELQKPHSVQIVPVKNVGKTVQFGFAFNSKAGAARRPEAKRLDERTFRWDLAEQSPNYVRIAGDMALISESLDAIQAIEDRLPGFLLQDESLELATVHVDWRHVPPAWKKTWVATGMKLAMNQNSAGKLLGAGMLRFVEDGESLSAALHVSPEDHEAYVQLAVTTKPDSTLDQAWNTFSRQPPRFAHILDPAAEFNFAASMRLPKVMTDPLQKRIEAKQVEKTAELLLGTTPKDKAVAAARRDFLDDLESVSRVWATSGRMDVAWSMSAGEHPFSIVAATLLGADLLDNSLGSLAENLSQISETAGANIPIADGHHAHRIAKDHLVSFTEEEVFVVAGAEQEARLKRAWDCAAASEAEPLPAFYFEADAASTVKQLGELNALPETIAALTEHRPIEGRLRLTVARGEHDVAAKLRLDEPLLRSLSSPVLKKMSEQMNQLVWQAAKGLFSSDAQTAPAVPDESSSTPQ